MYALPLDLLAVSRKNTAASSKSIISLARMLLTPNGYGNVQNLQCYGEVLFGMLWWTSIYLTIQNNPLPY
jgi:hypothetical protein